MRRGLTVGVVVALTLVLTLVGAPRPSSPLQPLGARLLVGVAVDSRHPRTVFLDGFIAPPGSGCEVEQPCPIWLMRSTDGGATWTDLTTAVQSALLSGSGGVTSVWELLLSVGGHGVYLGVDCTCGDATSSWSDVLYSLDDGATWNSVLRSGQGAATDGYVTGPVLAPRSSGRLYAAPWNNTATSSYFGTSNDGGRTWVWEPYPGPEYTFVGATIVPDSRRPDTVYANSAVYDGGEAGDYFMRSDDAGRHWTLVHSPVKHGFTIVAWPHEGELVVAQVLQEGRATTDQLYVSADEGRTWRVRPCPGDDHHRCPGFIVDNVFGAGASYGFLRSGIYRFHGAGAAEGRLPISPHLPFVLKDLVAVAAGSRFGDPIFAATGRRLYRSTNAGRSWRSIPVAQLPQGMPR